MISNPFPWRRWLVLISMPNRLVRARYVLPSLFPQSLLIIVERHSQVEHVPGTMFLYSPRPPPPAHAVEGEAVAAAVAGAPHAELDDVDQEPGPPRSLKRDIQNATLMSMMLPYRVHGISSGRRQSWGTAWGSPARSQCRCRPGS